MKTGTLYHELNRKQVGNASAKFSRLAWKLNKSKDSNDKEVFCMKKISFQHGGNIYKGKEN